MHTRTRRPHWVVIASGVIAVGTLLLPGCTRSEARRTGPTQAATGTPAANAIMQPVGSVRDVMMGLVVPSSTVVFQAGSTAPTTAEAWENARLHAVMMAEASHLLVMPGRAPDADAWVRLASAQRDAAQAASRAAVARDAAAMELASNNLYDTCENCHATYLKR